MNKSVLDTSYDEPWYYPEKKKQRSLLPAGLSKIFLISCIDPTKHRWLTYSIISSAVWIYIGRLDYWDKDLSDIKIRQQNWVIEMLTALSSIQHGVYWNCCILPSLLFFLIMILYRYGDISASSSVRKPSPKGEAFWPRNELIYLHLTPYLFYYMTIHLNFNNTHQKRPNCWRKCRIAIIMPFHWLHWQTIAWFNALNNLRKIFKI